MILRGDQTAGAAFSECNRYRYRLWRHWNSGLPRLCFIMLNPSTADELVNDPTIERCQRRARDLDYGSIEIVNLFGMRSTDPRELYKVGDPVGPRNIEAIVDAVRLSEVVICAWGSHGKYLGRGPDTLRRLQQFYPGRAHYLRLNSDGQPAHPLYLPYNLKPTRFETQERAA